MLRGGLSVSSGPMRIFKVALDHRNSLGEKSPNQGPISGRVVDIELQTIISSGQSLTSSIGETTLIVDVIGRGEGDSRKEHE